METKQLKPLPVGIQTFDKLIEGGYLYIDKTECIYRMIKFCKYLHLNRPRKFGKSLLVSTLQSYFEGRKELFKGLAIEQLEKEWKEHPVLCFDMSQGRDCSSAKELEQLLSSQLAYYEAIYCPKPSEDSMLSIRLNHLIQEAYVQTGQRVVVLIDDYDASLLNVLHDEKVYTAYFGVILDFFNPLKACDPYLEFILLTGTTRYSSPILSGVLNNLSSISMNPKFADICGITEEEVQTQMSDYMDCFAEVQGIKGEVVISRFNQRYGGYHFAWPSPDILNPFSLFCALQNRSFQSYWFETCTPTYLIEAMRRFEMQPSYLGLMRAFAGLFNAPINLKNKDLSLLYQSGCTTLKAYDRRFNTYTLGIPNDEVRISILHALIPLYMHKEIAVVDNLVQRMVKCFVKEDIEGALGLLQEFLPTIPYSDKMMHVDYYQEIIFIILALIPYYMADVEVDVPLGCVDMVMITEKALNLFGFKINAVISMDKIDLNDYPSRFAMCGLPIIKVGINFDAEKRTIGDWKIVSCNFFE